MRLKAPLSLLTFFSFLVQWWFDSLEVLLRSEGALGGPPSFTLLAFYGDGITP